jgi:hypothetical protein
MRSRRRGRSAFASLLLGSLTIDQDTLALETNSVARADALAATIEHVCGDLLSGRSRVHTDPLSTLDRPDPADLTPEAENTPEENALIRKLKVRHYRKWADEPIPALDGNTPRAMVRSSAGRRRVKRSCTSSRCSRLPTPRTRGSMWMCCAESWASSDRPLRNLERRTTRGLRRAGTAGSAG